MAQKETPDDPIQPSVDRARSSAFNLLAKSINALRRLQTDRTIAMELFTGLKTTPMPDLTSYRDVIPTLNINARRRQREGDAAMKEILSAPMPGKPGQGHAAEAASSLASNCKTIPEPQKQIARNAQCPCGSGEKYKRCCGKNAPPVLNMAA